MPTPEQSDVRNTNIVLSTAVAAPAPSAPSPDPWSGLRRFTAARIALGRTGGSQRTGTVLDFRLSHARARDAVHATFDTTSVSAALAAANLASETLATAATNRREYLLRPDLGRRLDDASRAKLSAFANANSNSAHANPDLVIIVSDGLAAQAAERHAAATILPLVATLSAAGWRIAPVLIAPFARVKVQDEIGAALGARFTLMLLGERPGLGAPDSLGAYFTANPRADRTDADRNCVSNIRAEGIPPAQAAAKLAWLLRESSRTGLGGVQLKDTQSLPGAID
jgi:ethanolamine ammonia-lyase small subunit